MILKLKKILSRKSRNDIKHTERKKVIYLTAGHYEKKLVLNGLMGQCGVHYAIVVRAPPAAIRSRQVPLLAKQSSVIGKPPKEHYR